jgi:hypothetical protein
VKTSPFDHFVPSATVRVDGEIDDFDDAAARSWKNDNGNAALRRVEDISRIRQLNDSNLRSPVHHYKI